MTKPNVLEPLASGNLADETGYQSNQHQAGKEPGHCTFSGTADNGTSAARHGFPLCRLYA